MSLESLAWGSYREQKPAGLSPVVLALVDELQKLLSDQQAREVLGFHQSSVAWMHNVLYMPFFVRRCEAYLNGLLQQDVAWLTLYCAVLCVSLRLILGMIGELTRLSK